MTIVHPINIVELKEELTVLLVAIEKAEEIRSDRIKEAIAANGRGERALSLTMKQDIEDINISLIDLRNQLREINTTLSRNINALGYVPLEERNDAWEERLNSPAKASGIIRKGTQWFQKTSIGRVAIKSPAHLIINSPLV